MSKIYNAVVDYLDARDAAAKWSNPRYTEEANRDERATRTKPAREAMEAQIRVARQESAGDRAAYADALATALHDDTDANRLLTRELAWGRLVRRMDAGETLEVLVRDGSVIELEAIATLAPGELARLQPSAPATQEQRQAVVDDLVMDTYASHPSNKKKFGELAQKAQEADTTLALASLGDALLAGRRPDNQTANQVYLADAELYRRIAD